MQWLQIRAGFASSRRKKESSLHCKISIFSLVKSRTPEFLAKNPSGGVPVLEFDDGSCLARTGADRDVEPADGTGAVCGNRTHDSKYESNLSGSLQAIPGLR